MRAGVMAAVVAVTLAGCGGSGWGPIKPKLTNEPMPTDGPNQVVLQVPGMS
jgi:hypothetical protein